MDQWAFESPPGCDAHAVVCYYSRRMPYYLDAIDTIFYARLARDADGRYDWDSGNPDKDLAEWIRYTRQDDSLPEDERRELELIAKVAQLIDTANRPLIDEILKEITSIWSSA